MNSAALDSAALPSTRQIESLTAELAVARAALEIERSARRRFAERLRQEFRIPLDAMLGFSQLLKTSLRENQDSLEKILGTGQELVTLIQEMSAEEIPATPAAIPAATPEPSAPPRVLYIEDQITNVQMVQLMLHRSLGLEVISAETGRLGIEQAVETRPDVILLDLNLPDMHGSDVIRSLQEMPGTARIPVIVLSGDAAPSQIDRLLAAGARDYLVKPFRIDRLKTSVETLLREVRPAA